MRQLICLLFIICISLSKETPTTFAEITITLKSVTGKNVVVTLSSTGTGESALQFSAADATIANVVLTDSSDFNEALTCANPAIGAPGDVACTISNAATAGTKYKLGVKSGETEAEIIGTDSVTATKLADTQVTAGGEVVLQENMKHSHQYKLH